MNDDQLHANRRANFKTILEKYRTKKEFSDASGLSTAQVSQLCSDNQKYKIGHDVARRIEATAAKPDGWLDINHDEAVEEFEELDLIVRTVSIVNELLQKHDMTPNRLKREKYEAILRNCIATSVQLGVVTPNQVQHSLFSFQLQELTH